MQTALDGKQGIPVSDSAYEENGASGVEAWLNMEEIELDDEQEAAPVEVCATPEELADRYRFMKVLGEGSQGKVYLAERRSDGKKVAIKQLRIDSVKTWKEYTLFHREADVLASLDIPGVVKLYEACDYLDADPPCSYIVQEYVEGVTLKEALKSGYRFSLARAYDIFLQMIDILEKLHSHEPPVIHRDIKPSNIILKILNSDRIEVCLIDFGAVSNPKVQSGGSTVAGTFGYMSPEQMIGRATPQSDTYALAAMFAYIISGVDPAEMKTQDLRLVIDPYVENHPVALVQMLRRMLEPDIENRLADLGELRRRVNAFKQGHYEFDQSIQRFSSNDLIRRLKTVKYLCQPQNLEIWQALPDRPEDRQPFPLEVRTKPRFLRYPVKRIGGDSSDWLQREKVASFDFIGWYEAMPVTMSFVIYFIIFMAYGILINALNISINSYFRMNIELFVAFGVPLILTVLAIIAMFSIHRYKEKNGKSVKGRLPYIDADNYVNSEKCTHHVSVYAKGIKTIATIVRIEFIPANKVMFMSHHVEEAPKFRVYYKFNPPDDDWEDDLVHYVDTHRDPEGLFKEGDPLPILYDGQKVPDKPMHVTTSMPYPFPLEDLELPEDYIFGT